MNVLQHTRNELNLCLKENRPDRSYRDTLLIVWLEALILSFTSNFLSSNSGQRRVIGIIRENELDTAPLITRKMKQ